MKIIATTICILLAVHASGQQRTVTGRLTDDVNDPLPGVNVVIKGTNEGTNTDADGRYSIVAPIGSILVFSFIGMQTQEVLVTRHGLSGIKTRIPASDLVQPGFSSSWADMPVDTTGWNKPGVAVIDRGTGKILNKFSINPDEIMRIRKLGNNFLLQTRYPDNTQHALNFQFTTSTGVENVNRWPLLQSTYSQGRPSGGEARWNGAETGEIFSHGPLVRTLEYDGSVYAYDANGRLVAKGTGNGVAATSFDPRRFFNTILAATTQLSAGIRLQNQSTFSASYEKNDRGGIIPGSWASINNFSLRLKEFRVSNRLKISASTNMQLTSGELLQHGSNLSNIIYSVYRTPPTFNNSNNLSHAAFADNPYDLSANLPDSDRGRRSTSLLLLTYDITNAIKFNINSNYDYQSASVVNGFIPGGASMSEGRITERNTRQHFFNSTASIDYTGSGNWWQQTGRIIYRINNQDDRVERNDAFGFTRNSFLENQEGDSTLSTANHLTRTSHEFSVMGGFSKYDHVTIKFANRAYFSNTASINSYVNFFPSASIEYNVGRYLGFNRLMPYAMISRNISEAPMIWSGWAHSSTRQNMQSAMSVYENGELFSSTRLSPETDLKFETGVKTTIGNGLNLEAGYYNNTSSNMIAPVWRSERFELSNAARVNTTGWLASVNRAFYFYPEMQIYVELNWSKYNSLVRELNSAAEYIPLAGFRETASVLAEGQPVGAIYGTSYLRDNTGALVIDGQGFPIVDGRVKMIGNPIPTWTGGTTLSFSYRQRFKVWTVLDYRSGGDRWNGTQRVLDYLGVSQASADQRTISNYVFEGNNVNGKPNVIPVMFANAAGSISDNRWVRDGYAGAAEEYIEDASWVRMGTLGFSFATHTPGSVFMKWIQVSVLAKNVFLLTKYHGSDPSTSLFGYANGSGLDFFNVPGVKSFYGSVSIKF